MSTEKVIVTTTINPPTEAIACFDALDDWTLIVVSDQRTPPDYRLENGIFLTPEEQERLAPEVSELIGWNCIQRRNLGFVLALDMGAEIIATVDDDNIPYDGWGRDLLVGTEATLTSYAAPNGCFDPIGAAGLPQLWHRGYPLQLLRTRDYGTQEPETLFVDIQADFWDGDPDIDAVCRLEHAPDVTFDPGRFPFTSRVIGPFNSQNTFLTRDALSRYFCLPAVGREDDIWAAYHMHSLGFRVAFAKPSVRQERNPQDLTRNLRDEFIGYEHNARLVQSINDGSYQPADFWPERTLAAYDAYLRRVKA